MKKERFILGTVIALLALCVAYLSWQHYFAFRKEDIVQKVPQNAPLYAGVEVFEKEILLTQKFIGTVIPVHTVDVFPFISGFVEEVFVKGGQKVKAGEVLFVLQQKQYLAQKEAAKANVQSAKASLKNAEIYLNRIKKTKSQAISETELDNATTSYEAALANLKAEKAKLLSAEVNYAYTVIKAPIDGVVGNISITKGNYVAPAGQALARIIQQSPIRVVFSMSNKAYLDILDSAQALFDKWAFKLKLANGRMYPLKGQFQYVDNEISQNTSSISVYIDFDNPNGLLMANAYVDVIAEKKVKGIALEKSLVHLTKQGAYANVIRNGKIEKTPLSLGMSTQEDYLILKGLSAGDYVLKGKVPDQMIGTPAQRANLK